MFEPVGGVSARIQQRRVLAIRRALGRPGPFKAIAQAHGFAGASNASRAFRAAFGQTPGEYRQACREPAAASTGLIEQFGKADFARWSMEVR